MNQMLPKNFTVESLHLRTESERRTSCRGEPITAETASEQHSTISVRVLPDLSEKDHETAAPGSSVSRPWRLWLKALQGFVSLNLRQVTETVKA